MVTLVELLKEADTLKEASKKIKNIRIQGYDGSCGYQVLEVKKDYRIIVSDKSTKQLILPNDSNVLISKF